MSIKGTAKCKLNYTILWDIDKLYRHYRFSIIHNIMDIRGILHHPILGKCSVDNHLCSIYLHISNLCSFNLLNHHLLTYCIRCIGNLQGQNTIYNYNGIGHNVHIRLDIYQRDKQSNRLYDPSQTHSHIINIGNF